MRRSWRAISSVVLAFTLPAHPPSVVEGSSDWHDVLPTPLTWTDKALTEGASSLCSDPKSNAQWICGGKSNGIEISDTCDLIEVTNDGRVSSKGQSKQMRRSTIFTGYYENIPGFFCEAMSAVHSSLTEKSCYFSANDGTSNKAVCYCCDLDKAEQSRSNVVECSNLSLTGQCPPLYDSCVLEDDSRGQMIQIGGYNGREVYDNVLCFDFETERFTYNDVQTSQALLRESEIGGTRNQDVCGYGNLAVGVYNSGCAMLKERDDGLIVVVGGRTPNGYSGNGMLVQICKRNKQDCYISTALSGDVDLYDAKVIPLDSCMFAVFGGRRSSTEMTKAVRFGDVCNEEWLDSEQDEIPQELSEFAMIADNGQLCLVGGTYIQNGKSTADVSDRVYCTEYHPLGEDDNNNETPSPTKRPTDRPTFPPTPRPTTPVPTRRPTKHPTAQPTNEPTKNPSVTPEGRPVLTEDWDTAFTYDRGVYAQACADDDDSFMVMGGKTVNSNGDGEVLNIMTYFHNSDFNQAEEYSMMKKDPFKVEPMKGVYCEHQCSAKLGDRLYLFSPYLVDAANDIHLFECVIDHDEKQVTCEDLCTSQGSKRVRYCEELLGFELCATQQGSRVFISGGSTGSVISNYISVFDLELLDWVSVPQGSLAQSDSGLSSWFGSLSVAVKAHSCSMSGNELIILGGKSNGNKRTEVQSCVMNDNSADDSDSDDDGSGSGSSSPLDCTQTQTLSVGRAYASALTMGSTILVVCGEDVNGQTIDTAEIYNIDAQSMQEAVSSSIPDLPYSAKSCCVIDHILDKSLFISGGASVINNRAVPNDEIQHAEYGIAPIDSESSQLRIPLTECRKMILQTESEWFGDEFTLMIKVDPYSVWTNDDQSMAIYYDSNTVDYCWIGNYDYNIWAYYNHGFNEGYWNILDGSGTTSWFAFNCLEALNEENGDGDSDNDDDGDSDDHIIGMKPVIFWTVLSSLIVMLIVIGVLIWRFREKLSKSHQAYSRPSNSKRNAHNNNHHHSNNNDDDYHGDSVGGQRRLFSSNVLFATDKADEDLDAMEEETSSSEGDTDQSIVLANEIHYDDCPKTLEELDYETEMKDGIKSKRSRRRVVAGEQHSTAAATATAKSSSHQRRSMKKKKMVLPLSNQDSRTNTTSTESVQSNEMDSSQHARLVVPKSSISSRHASRGVSAVVIDHEDDSHSEVHPRRQSYSQSQYL